jgi:hypothetical protein
MDVHLVSGKLIAIKVFGYTAIVARPPILDAQNVSVNPVASLNCCLPDALGLFFANAQLPRV